MSKTTAAKLAAEMAADLGQTALAGQIMTGQQNGSTLPAPARKARKKRTGDLVPVRVDCTLPALSGNYGYDVRDIKTIISSTIRLDCDIAKVDGVVTASRSQRIVDYVGNGTLQTVAEKYRNRFESKAFTTAIGEVMAGWSHEYVTERVRLNGEADKKRAQQAVKNYVRVCRKIVLEKIDALYKLAGQTMPKLATSGSDRNEIKETADAVRGNADKCKRYVALRDGLKLNKVELQEFASWLIVDVGYFVT